MDWVSACIALSAALLSTGWMPHKGIGVDLHVPSLAELHGRRSWKWDGQPDDVLASTVAEMDFAVAEPIKAELQAAVSRDDLGYPPTQVPRLVGAFVDFAGRRLNWRVDPDQVRLVPDVMVGVLALARLLVGPNRSVAVATPAYRPFLVDPPSIGLAVRQVPLGVDGAADLDALTEVFASGTRVLILANPHNPTGRVLAREQLERLAELCAQHEVWVIADEIHAPLVLSGAIHVPWLEVSDAAREHGFALTAASKAFNLAGLKAAQLVTASARTRVAAERLAALREHVGLLGLLAAEVAFTHCDGWLDAILDQLARNRELLGALLDERLPAIRWDPPQASYLAWLDCRALGLGGDPANVFLDRGRVALAPGVNYGAGEGHVRLNFGTSAELVTEMVRRMADAVGDAAHLS